jgi:RNA polymerase primary sigma factor
MDSLIEVGQGKGLSDLRRCQRHAAGRDALADDLDDLITTIGTQGIDLLDGPKFGGDKDFELEEGEDVELDLTPWHARKNQ